MACSVVASGYARSCPVLQLRVDEACRLGFELRYLVLLHHTVTSREKHGTRPSGFPGCEVSLLALSLDVAGWCFLSTTARRHGHGTSIIAHRLFRTHMILEMPSRSQSGGHLDAQPWNHLTHLTACGIVSQTMIPQQVSFYLVHACNT